MPEESRFQKVDYTVEGREYPFWHTRSPGQPVLLLHALNGISPRTMDLALQMETWGYRVYVPSLFGIEISGAPAYDLDDGARTYRYVKNSPDWKVRSLNDSGVIIDHIREMTRWVAARENRRDLIVIGNCMSGMFPLSVLDEPHVRTAVLAQPAAPFKTVGQVFLRLPQPPWAASAYGLSGAQIESTLQALEREPQKRIIGFHYTNDPVAPFVKFERLARDLKKRGLENRFRTYLLSPAHSLERRQGESWTVVEQTVFPRRALYPHSTIINAATCEDREWFREKLREALAD